jgi:hypothetical protein
MAHGCFISLRGTWCYQEKSAGLASSGELHSVDLGSGKTDSVLPGVSVTDYDISGDEKEVAFTTTESGGESQIWLASLDRRKPPRQIARAGDQVSFGADGDLVFRSLEEKTNWLVRIKKDGRERERITTRRSWKSSAFRPTVNGRSYSHLGLARMPYLQRSQCPSTVALPRKSVSQTACQGGLPTGDSSMWRALRRSPRTPRERRSRFLCQPANHCRICPLLESTCLPAGLPPGLPG